jgi:hypothetical protein
MLHHSAVLVKNAVRVFLYELVSIGANVARVFVILNLYLTDLQTYHSHFIPGGVAEVSQIFL